MNLPIEQVERIEVIRGPGSILYGEYAFSGVINVVTYTNTNRGFVGYSRYNSPVAGGTLYRELAEGVTISLNLSTKRSDGARHDSGQDKSSNSGGLNTHREFSNLFAALSIDETLLEAHYMRNGKGDHFGIGDLLPPTSNSVVITDELLKVDLTHPFTLTDQLSAELQIDYSYGGFDMDNLYAAPTNYAIGPYSYPDGRLADIVYREERYDSNFELDWKNSNNRLLIGAHLAQVGVVDTWQRLNYDPTASLVVGNNNSPTQVYSGPDGLVKEDANRTITSLYLQDQYQWSDQLALTLGGRFDHYSDMGDSTTPSISALYELNNKNILKAQYAEAFRPPSFNELYTMNNPVVNGNDSLKGETIATSELSHIYKTGEHSLRSTLFYSQFESLIYKNITNQKYENSGEGWHQGVELELERKINSNWKVDGNLSWIETHDKDNNHDLEGAPEWLSNLSLTWQPHTGHTLTAHLRYVGDRKRSASDSRYDLEGFQAVDIIGNWRRVFSSDVNLRAGVHNLFDADIRYPASFDADIRYPASPSTYSNDYPQQGRSWWLRLSQNF
jgi:iron complex outermembrane receptor protein